MLNKSKEPSRRYVGMVLSSRRLLYARYVCGGRAFFALDDFKGDFIANLQFVICHALQFFGMKEEILCFAFARNESESFFRKSLDSSFHTIVFIINYTEKLDFVSVSYHTV